MDPTQRARFNAAFTAEGYGELQHLVNGTERWPADFRIAESPIFLTPEFGAKLIRAGWEIVEQLRTPEFAEHARGAIPPGLEVPGETPHPLFLQVDFGICADAEVAGGWTPQLIELQGFPSLYAFQSFAWRSLVKAFPAIPGDWTPFFSGLDEGGYDALLRRTILAGHAPENVILLEIDPATQKTRVDFACTETLLGVQAVNITEVIRRGTKLYYQRDGQEVRIERIYNRLIFDELLRRPELEKSLSFRLQDEVEVEWAGHPNWYFRISKHSLPFLRGECVPPAFFADEFPASETLSDYVLKPLYSFAGLGVDIEPTAEKLAALAEPQAWILQRKVTYGDVIETVDGNRSKAEIRLMFLWPPDGEPVLANNLVRLSQGKMMGVDFNKEKTWVGSSIGLMAPGI